MTADTLARKHISELLCLVMWYGAAGKNPQYAKEPEYIAAQAFLDTPILAVQSVEGGEGEPRFFIDHGMIHDRIGGHHVTTAPDDEAWNGGTITGCCELLNGMAAQLTKQAEEMAGIRRAVLEDVVKYHDTSANYAMAACWGNDAYAAGNANERLRVHERAAEHFRALIEPKTAGEG